MSCRVNFPDPRWIEWVITKCISVLIQVYLYGWGSWYFAHSAWSEEVLRLCILVWLHGKLSTVFILRLFSSLCQVFVGYSCSHTSLQNTTWDGTWAFWMRCFLELWDAVLLGIMELMWLWSLILSFAFCFIFVLLYSVALVLSSSPIELIGKKTVKRFWG